MCCHSRQCNILKAQMGCCFMFYVLPLQTMQYSQSPDGMLFYVLCVATPDNAIFSKPRWDVVLCFMCCRSRQCNILKAQMGCCFMFYVLPLQTMQYSQSPDGML